MKIKKSTKDKISLFHIMIIEKTNRNIVALIRFVLTLQPSNN